MFLILQKILTVFLLLGFSQAFAQSSRSDSGLSFIAGLAWGPGIAKSEVGILSRKMSATRAHALLGIKISGLTLGAMGQYLLVEQATDPAEVAGSDLASKGYTLGGGASFNLGNIVVQGSYDFSGRQELKKKILNETAIYQKPTGFTVILGYKFNPNVTFDIMFSSHAYSELRVGSSDALNISSDKLTENFLGVGLGVIY